MLLGPFFNTFLHIYRFANYILSESNICSFATLSKLSANLIDQVSLKVF